jgi:flagellar motor component MotA
MKKIGIVVGLCCVIVGSMMGDNKNIGPCLIFVGVGCVMLYLSTSKTEKIEK